MLSERGTETRDILRSSHPNYCDEDRSVGETAYSMDPHTKGQSDDRLITATPVSAGAADSPSEGAEKNSVAEPAQTMMTPRALKQCAKLLKVFRGIFPPSASDAPRTLVVAGAGQPADCTPLNWSHALRWRHSNSSDAPETVDLDASNEETTAGSYEQKDAAAEDDCSLAIEQHSTVDDGPAADRTAEYEGKCAENVSDTQSTVAPEATTGMGDRLLLGRQQIMHHEHDTLGRDELCRTASWETLDSTAGDQLDSYRMRYCESLLNEYHSRRDVSALKMVVPSARLKRYENSGLAKPKRIRPAPISVPHHRLTAVITRSFFQKL
eukprot:GHVS01034997.1.p1 GENE.GHVS01034997.1~~GHVS01034997.1.p1  ORF type:complete len:324 (+),score=44.17 GHVS01034997.1:171-1142(+)